MPPLRLLVLMPVRNDWTAARTVVERVGRELQGLDATADILLIDDGSLMACPPAWTPGGSIRQLQVLELKRNLGHQRAICVGLAHAAEHCSSDAVLVMDADGEDDPSDVPRLVEEFERQGRQTVVFAERRKRSESLLFRLGYASYRALHRVLVGDPVRVGNFSLLPGSRLSSLLVVPELWSHYAAAVIVSQQPYCTIPTHRARRLDGKSSMSVVKLVVHGMSALTVYNDRIGARLLLAGVMAAGVAGLLFLVMLASFLIGRPWTPAPMGIVILSTLLLFNGLSLAALFCSLTLGVRSAGTFLPARDYHWFVGEVRTLFRVEDSGDPSVSTVSSTATPAAQKGPLA